MGLDAGLCFQRLHRLHRPRKFCENAGRPNPGTRMLLQCYPGQTEDFFRVTMLLITFQHFQTSLPTLGSWSFKLASPSTGLRDCSNAGLLL